MTGQGTSIGEVGLGTGLAALLITAIVEMPVRSELRTEWHCGKFRLDVSPVGATVLHHVTAGDAVGDSLVAERCHEPVEQDAGIVVPDGGGNTFSSQFGANLI